MEMKIKQSVLGGLLIAALAGGIVSCAKDPYRSSGRVLDDRMTTSRVKSALNHSPVYKFPEVDVKTYNGIVQLNGFVHREEQKAVASEVARGTEGVRDVINNITLLPQDAAAYGGTVDPKTGVRGSGTNHPSSIVRSPNQ
jgi:hypothetical protein